MHRDNLEKSKLSSTHLLTTDPQHYFLCHIESAGSCKCSEGLPHCFSRNRSRVLPPAITFPMPSRHNYMCLKASSFKFCSSMAQLPKAPALHIPLHSSRIHRHRMMFASFFQFTVVEPFLPLILSDFKANAPPGKVQM